MTDLSILSFEDDLSKVEKPDPLPEGSYVATIIKAEPTTSASSGNVYIATTFRIAPEEYRMDFSVENAPDGVLLTYRRAVVKNGDGSALSRSQSYMLRTFFEACGVKPGKQVDVNDMIGADAVVTVRHETYEGELRPSVSKIEPKI